MLKVAGGETGKREPRGREGAAENETIGGRGGGALGRAG